MIYSQDDTTKLRQWIALLNDLFGVISFTMAITAILSPYPSEIATFSIIFITLWGFAKGRPFREAIQRFQEKNGSTKTNVFLFSGAYMFVLGFISLLLVASGVVTMDSLKGLSIQFLLFK